MQRLDVKVPADLPQRFGLRQNQRLRLKQFLHSAIEPWQQHWRIERWRRRTQCLHLRKRLHAMSDRPVLQHLGQWCVGQRHLHDRSDLRQTNGLPRRPILYSELGLRPAILQNAEALHAHHRAATQALPARKTFAFRPIAAAVRPEAHTDCSVHRSIDGRKQRHLFDRRIHRQLDRRLGRHEVRPALTTGTDFDGTSTSRPAERKACTASCQTFDSDCDFAPVLRAAHQHRWQRPAHEQRCRRKPRLHLGLRLRHHDCADQQLSDMRQFSTPTPVSAAIVARSYQPPKGRRGDHCRLPGPSGAPASRPLPIRKTSTQT